MSKTILPLTKESSAPQYWRSVEHLADKPEVREMIEREFPEGASTIDAPTRRTFLTLMSASFAMMGLTGCVRRPEEKIIPYQKMPEGLIPGIPQFYASAASYYGEAIGMLVESHEGRPTKIEGNPDHPASLGGTLPWMQGLVLDLYDPDRLQAPTHDKKPVPFDEVKAALTAKLAGAERDGGSKLRILLESTTSPSVARLRRAVLKRFPKARFHVYDAVTSAEQRAGTKLAFGEPLRAIYGYDRAKTIVSVDADFLATEPGSIHASKLFTRGRRVLRSTDRMSRLWVAEPALTVTGANADHRFRVPASQAEEFLLALGAQLASMGVSFGSLQGKLKASPVVPVEALKALADDLAKARGASVIVVGSRQPAHVQALGHAINDALGNTGKTVRFTRVPEADLLESTGDLKALVDDINKGGVDTLLVLGGNPVYGAPGDVDLGAALAKVPTRVALSSHEDETSTKCDWVIPLAHELESWGDVRSADGTLTLVQPLIAPIFDGKTVAEILALVAKSAETRGHDIVRATFRELGPGGVAAMAAAAQALPTSTAAPAATTLQAVMDKAAAVGLASASASASAAPAASASASAAASASGSAMASASAPPAPPPPPPAPVDERHDKPWRRALHDGVLRAQPSFVEAKLDLDAIAKVAGAKPAAAMTSSALEVTFAPDNAVHDGRFANVAWLVELPHPITKTVWDNCAWVSPKLATELSLESGDVVKLSVGGRSIDIPVWIVPGNADYSVTLHLGWGRKMLGRIGDGRGFNVAPLRSTAAMGFAGGATLSKAGSRYQIAVTQEHNMLEGRPIVQENTLEGLKKDPKFTHHAVHHPPLLPLWEERKYEGHKWGMVVDLNACTGCSACVIACQAENNIPTVGKEQVTRQREMHWLRIDRYFSGTLDEPKVVNQPMACVQCENAPCENVCPVNATSHSPEGLNEMTYNRCIGTRYCSNNCPYKVRRFNFLDYHEDVPETIKLVANPNVTVRMRGVMEKCTYCVQRIQAAKIASKRDNRKLRDGDIVTACQQACPADAIVFGDLNDRSSRVARLSQVDHGFAVLEEINTKPRTTYLAKIRNPHPALAEAAPAAHGKPHSEHG